jgi:hypothetical protein
VNAGNGTIFVFVDKSRFVFQGIPLQRVVFNKEHMLIFGLY